MITSAGKWLKENHPDIFEEYQIHLLELKRQRSKEFERKRRMERVKEKTQG